MQKSYIFANWRQNQEATQSCFLPSSCSFEPASEHVYYRGSNNKEGDEVQLKKKILNIAA